MLNWSLVKTLWLLGFNFLCIALTGFSSFYSYNIIKLLHLVTYKAELKAPFQCVVPSTIANGNEVAL